MTEARLPGATRRGIVTYTPLRSTWNSDQPCRKLPSKCDAITTRFSGRWQSLLAALTGLAARRAAPLFGPPPSLSLPSTQPGEFLNLLGG